MARSSAKPNQSALLRLAPELRNEIYALAFTSADGKPLLATSEPELLRTCRQVRKEASSLFYSSAIIQITITDDDTRKITTWLKKKPSTLLARIPKLVIDIKDSGAIMAELESRRMTGMDSVVTDDKLGRWIRLGKTIRRGGFGTEKVEIEHTEVARMYCVARKSYMQDGEWESWLARQLAAQTMRILWLKGESLLDAMRSAGEG